MGRKPSPESPPVTLPSTIRRVEVSMRMAGIVLQRVRASAPPATAAFAIRVMSGTLGASLAKTGRSVLAFTAATAVVGQGGAVAEQRAVIHIGAAQVQLYGLEAGHSLGDTGHFGELAHAVGREAEQHGSIPSGPFRGQVAHGRLNAGVRQPDGIQEQPVSVSPSLPGTTRGTIWAPGFPRAGYG